MNWTDLYDEKLVESGKNVEFLDVGCGYGGLLSTFLTIFSVIICLIKLTIRSTVPRSKVYQSITRAMTTDVSPSCTFGFVNKTQNLNKLSVINP